MAFRSEQQRKAVFASIGRGIQKTGGRVIAGARHAFGTNQQMRDIQKRGGLRGKYLAAGSLGGLALAGGALALGGSSILKTASKETSIINKISKIKFAQRLGDANRANARYSTMLTGMVRKGDRGAKHLPKLEAMLKGTRRKATRQAIGYGAVYG